MLADGAEWRRTVLHGFGVKEIQLAQEPADFSNQDPFRSPHSHV